MKTLIIVSLLMAGAFSGNAQLNFKKKFEKKADQVVDDLLFGKKKKDKTEPNSGSTSSEASDGYESDSDGAPNGGYERKPVDYSSISTGETMHFRQLIDFLPDRVGAYSLAEKPQGASMRFGESSYSYGTKIYEDGGEERLSINLYDYLFTAAMFGSYANAYEYETTEGIMKSVEVDGQPGWYSTTYESGTTQLSLIINNRFLLSINLKGASEEDMRSYASSLDLEKLPMGEASEGPTDETSE